MTRTFYSRKVLDIFLNPPDSGYLDNPDGEGEATNPACSDVARLTLRIRDNRIEDARFQTQGCVAAIAAGAATVALIRGKTVRDAEQLSIEDVVEWLDGLPPAKVGCSVIAPEALRNAIADWRSKKSR
jgi:nitrogen fixation protein NifU and related proteins